MVILLVLTGWVVFSYLLTISILDVIISIDDIIANSLLLEEKVAQERKCATGGECRRTYLISWGTWAACRLGCNVTDEV